MTFLLIPKDTLGRYRQIVQPTGECVQVAEIHFVLLAIRVCLPRCHFALVTVKVGAYQGYGRTLNRILLVIGAVFDLL